ncbi:hypothetical protein [Polaribacter batillariae]|uniref:hypothetical protein n=1 Tax=Polaribacter batillariae TaxID=2808900 RepID=UPI001FB19883|nr:hypothetical protein [Polaribacter batillariae]
MKSIKNRLLFNFTYFFLWVGYFVFARLFFLLFNFDKTKELDFVTILKTFVYGLRLDGSFASYLSIIPFLLIIFTVFFPTKIIEKIIKWYSYILIILVTIFLLLDVGLYEAWGVRLDTTFFTYLNTPEVMLASVSSFQIILGTLFLVIFSFIFIKWFQKNIHLKMKNINKGSGLQIPLFLIITALLIIPLRGGCKRFL